MANPTRSVLVAEWANAIKVLDDLRRYASASGGTYPQPNATNFITALNTLQTSYQGDWLDDEEAAVEGIRGLLANGISPSTIQGVHRPWLRQFCKSVIGRTNLQSDSDMWQELYKYCVDNSFYVQSRAFTYGTPTADGGNRGNGQIVRLTRDRYNFPIESGYVDSKRAICVADENTGVRIGQEIFSVVGQSSARDELERSGSGLTGQIQGLTIADSLLNNAGYRTFGGTAGSDAPTSLQSWTSTDLTGASLAYNVTNYGIDQTNYFREAPNDGTPGSLTVKVSARLTQTLENARQIALDNNTPYLLVLVWNRALGSASGTLNVRLGGVTTTVAVSAQTGWQVTTVPSPIGQSCWYRQFAQDALQFQIEWIKTSGTLYLAEILLVPATQFDGTYYWALPSSTSAYIPWRVLDEFTWPDLATGSAKFQNFIHRAYPGVYLPSSNGSSIGFTEP